MEFVYRKLSYKEPRTVYSKQYKVPSTQHQGDHEVLVNPEAVALEGLEGEDEEGDEEAGQGQDGQVDVDVGQDPPVPGPVVFCHCAVLLQGGRESGKCYSHLAFSFIVVQNVKIITPTLFCIHLTQT